MNSRVFECCEEFYETLVQDSKPREVQGISCIVFEGSLVRKFQGMGVSQGYYSRVTDSLKSMGCISVLRRGSRALPSLIVLHHPPDADEFLLLDHTGKLALTKAAEAARLILSGLGGKNIVDILDNIDKRLQDVEQTLRDNDLKRTGEVK